MSGCTNLDRSIVGWAKALARTINTKMLSCAVPTRHSTEYVGTRGHGARETFCLRNCVPCRILTRQIDRRSFSHRRPSRAVDRPLPRIGGNYCAANARPRNISVLDRIEMDVVNVAREVRII